MSRTRPPKPPQRALIYARGTAAELEQQIDEAYALCRSRGQVVVGIVRDGPGAARGYHDAHRMLRHGEADLIAVASGAVLPDLLESATGGLPRVRIREVLDQGQRRRRIRLIRREDGGA